MTSPSTSSTVELVGKIEQFIRDDLLAGAAGDFSTSDPLLELGIIDSLGLLDVVMFLEESFGISIEEFDMTMENFGSIDDMARYVSERQTAPS